MQKEIINHKEGALLVMASAGSGKTRVLTERIKQLLENPNEKFHVLALTFTNKAADELTERLSDSQDIENRAFVGTFHKFCLDVIQKHGYAIGLKEQPHIFEKNEDRTNILIQVFEKPENWDLRKYYENKDLKGKQLFISNALTYISRKKKNLKGIEKFNELDDDLENQKIQKMYNEYNDLLNIQNAMDFDDVIIKAYQIFSDRPAIAKLYRKQFKYIFIDEAQDLNFAQYELLKVLCNAEHKNVMMVGDVKQSLYHFNGSDIKYMNEYFKRDFNPLIKVLNTNFRSSQKIIEVANKVINDSMTGYETQIVGKFKIFDDCKDERDEAEKVVSEIENYLKEGLYNDKKEPFKITHNDIAVLSRNRYLLKHVEETLKTKEIPYYFKKSNDGLSFDSQIIEVFDLGVRILINSIDQLHFADILKKYKIDVELNAFSEYEGLKKLIEVSSYIKDDNEKEKYFVLIKSWEILHKQTKFNLRESLQPIKEYFLSENENSVQEPKEVYESKMINEYESIRFDLEELENYYNIYARNTSSELKSLSHFRTQLSLGLIITEKEENGIVLSTIHLAKGLEFPIVFVIGLDDGSLPYYKSKNEGGKALNEEKNIFYVAVTRAKRALYLSYPQTRIMPWNPDKPKVMSPSEYLKGLKQLEN
ncbi:MAG: ATP-dependent helicase [Paludibacter sp.]|nr:ATP-dependent helicase [Paludibacter sp.]